VHYAKDIASLRTIARTTLNSPRVKQRDLDFAFAIARAADTIGKGQDARAAEILALAYFSRGDRDNAIANQERAIALQTDAKLKAQYEAQLAKYRTDEPKPVPYTPKPGTPGAAAPAATPPAGGGEGEAH
jgi:tetratricopeptide (TPR) repeat protein